MNSTMTKLRTVLGNPAIGFAPWILLSVIEGPGRVVLASVLAAALAVVLLAAGAITGMRPKLLDVTGIAFFCALAVIAALASPGTGHWLGLWSAELSNVMIAVIAGLSLAFRAPFTLQYARETTEQRYWKSPLFLRINYVITAVWAATFLLTAIVGYIGDGPLHQPNNIWTSWIIQIGLVVLAVKFTGWYPDHATGDAGSAAAAGSGAGAGADADAGAAAGQGGHRPVSELIRPVAAYFVPVGILIMILGGKLWWGGAILVVAGVVVTRRLSTSLRQRVPAPGTGQ
jgi:hypothetical protein